MSYGERSQIEDGRDMSGNGWLILADGSTNTNAKIVGSSGNALAVQSDGSINTNILSTVPVQISGPVCITCPIGSVLHDQKTAGATSTTLLSARVGRKGFQIKSLASNGASVYLHFGTGAAVASSDYELAPGETYQPLAGLGAYEGAMTFIGTAAGEDVRILEIT